METNLTYWSRFFKRKMAEEEKPSVISPLELTNNEKSLTVQETIYKSASGSLHLNDNTQINAGKQKAAEMRRNSLETISETRAQIDDELSKSNRSSQKLCDF